MDDARTRVAKVLRGTHRAVCWEEASDDCRNLWLARADNVLEAAVEPESKGRLIPDWWEVMKRAHSVKLAALAPIVIPIVWEVLSAAPPELRVIISIPIWALMAGAAVLARIWNQPAK